MNNASQASDRLAGNRLVEESCSVDTVNQELVSENKESSMPPIFVSQVRIP